jgi:uncharacterized protein YgbK (DUF1537 family)
MSEHTRDAAILADDLTGALDAGVQASKRGIETVVALEWPPLPEAPLVVLSSDSRDGAREQAAQRVRQAAEALRGRLLLKKIDSTMRGHLGAELHALVETLGLRGVLIAPSFPAAGRTVRQGVLYMGDRRLEETGFAQDPRWPMCQSHLPTLVGSQVGEPVALASLDDVAAGPEQLAKRIAALGAKYVVLDAVTDEHLRTIADAGAALGLDWLLCGSAGLAQAWAQRLSGGVGGAPAIDKRAGLATLVVAGSRHETTCRQVDALQRAGYARRLDLDPASALRNPLARLVLAAHCASALDAGRSVVLNTGKSALLPGSESEVAELLGATVAAVVTRCALAGLVLTGGDVAHACCCALGATGLRLGPEVQAGIPSATLHGGAADGLPVITKAGGFGDEQALVQALLFLGASLEK